MWWAYKKIGKTPDGYRYAYSRENREYDGIISYDSNSGYATMEKVCAADLKWATASDDALEHFCTIVDKGFPEEYCVCCG